MAIFEGKKEEKEQKTPLFPFFQLFFEIFFWTKVFFFFFLIFRGFQKREKQLKMRERSLKIDPNFSIFQEKTNFWFEDFWRHSERFWICDWPASEDESVRGPKGSVRSASRGCQSPRSLASVGRWLGPRRIRWSCWPEASPLGSRWQSASDKRLSMIISEVTEVILSLGSLSLRTISF